ncbi:hypothetical protein [Rhizosphaericola mali]|uniref:SWIM-type domain-containing protein n=1 Tax=Rhizosphaericola mali TaxID=2545455 RepID=A0A5P2G3I3_9BACT|nr:hypothetical protein [Rhizosphaericola mali]QES88689.1 hypothetical protein E0W69_008505 [Rhizosphaericola mali]
MANTKLPTYRLEFETPYVLSEDINFHKLYDGDHHSHAIINFKDFKKDFLAYYVQQEGYKKEEISIWISPQHVDIHCSCFSSEPIFCYHIFSVLWEVTYSKRDFFKIFEPSNLIEIVVKNPKLFHKNMNNSKNFIMPDVSLGALYEMDEIEKLKIANIPQAKTTTPPIHPSKRLAWLMVYSESRAYTTFPVIVPILELLNKKGVSLQRFEKGFEGIEVDNFKLLDQKRLYTICQEMITNTKKQSECYYKDLYEVSDVFVKCFHNWQDILPIISKEKYIYHFPIARIRYYINQKPMPKYIHEIQISDEPVDLLFTLKNKGSYYQLSLSFTTNGKIIFNPEIKGLFFISNDDKKHYMLSSIQDVVFAHWMSKHTFTMSVFKENFEEFEKEILHPIGKFYKLLKK